MRMEQVQMKTFVLTCLNAMSLQLIKYYLLKKILKIIIFKGFNRRRRYRRYYYEIKFSKQ